MLSWSSQEACHVVTGEGKQCPRDFLELSDPEGGSGMVLVPYWYIYFHLHVSARAVLPNSICIAPVEQSAEHPSTLEY